MMKRLMALLLVVSTCGCVTTNLRQSTLMETLPESTMQASIPPRTDITTYTDLLGSGIEKVEKICGTPDSLGIISAGEECFSRNRYWDIKLMGRSAGLEIDKHHQKVTRVKIKFAAMPAGQKRQFVEKIRADFLTKFGQYHLNSPAGYEWKDENGNVVYFSFHNSSLEIEYTSENWLKFLRGETTTYYTPTEVKSGREETFLVSQKSQVPSPSSAPTFPSPTSAEEKRKELSIREGNKPASDKVQEVTEHHGEELQQNSGEESNPADLQKVEEKKPPFGKIIQERLKISGFFQSLYRYCELDFQNDSFSLRRAKLKIDGHMKPELAYRIQIDAADSSDILRDAYVKWTKYPFANVIAGQTLIPFSKEQSFPAQNLKFIDRSRVTSNLSYRRDIGIQLCGKFFHKIFSYGAGIFNGAGENTTDNNDNKDVIGRLVFSPFKSRDTFLKGLSLGAAFQYGKQPRSGNTEGDKTVIGALAKYEYDKLKIQSEYLSRREEQIPELSDIDADGWYVTATYYFLPKFQGAVRYEQYDMDRDAPDREDIVTFGLNYFFNDYLKLQVNYLFKDEETSAGNNELAMQLQMKY